MAILITSDFPMDDSISKIKHAFKEHSLKIFAEVDHSSEAEKVDLPLNRTLVLIFGNPKAGTLLMQDNIEVALDLPLKVLLFEKDNKCFICYENPSESLQKYNLQNHDIINKMDAIYVMIRDSVTKQ